jgi:hypothetical protein
MSKQRHEDERSERNQERSREAHWQAAEAGAEENDQPPETPPEPHEPMHGGEDEGGALDRNPPGAAEKGASDRQQV